MDPSNIVHIPNDNQSPGDYEEWFCTEQSTSPCVISHGGWLEDLIDLGALYHVQGRKIASGFGLRQVYQAALWHHCIWELEIISWLLERFLKRHWPNKQYNGFRDVSAGGILLYLDELNLFLCSRKLAWLVLLCNDDPHLHISLHILFCTPSHLTFAPRRLCAISKPRVLRYSSSLVLL